MKINISYNEPMSFEQFKKDFEQHFLLANPARKEQEMQKSWEKAESRFPKKEEPKESQTSKAVVGDSVRYRSEDDNAAIAVPAIEVKKR